MHYKLTDCPVLDCECLVLGLFADGSLPEFSPPPEKEQQALISRLFKKLDGEGAWAWQAEWREDTSLLLIHCGEAKNFNSKNLFNRLDDLQSILSKQQISSASLCLPIIKDHSPDWQLQQLILRLEEKFYSLTEFKTTEKKPPCLTNVSIYLPGASKEGLTLGQTIANACNFARYLADRPANYCTPTYLGEQAETLEKTYDSISVNIMGLEALQSMKMGALLAVAQGSREEPRLIEIHYKTGGQKAPIVLVGKGITFDSGGLSLKPPNAMDEMKYDMSGAATVMGVLKACADLKLPLNVIGLIPSAENLPSGTAVKPGDVITSFSGQTIEVLNTDAEGRLILADALCYAERFNPQFVIDIATLTGAMAIALGHVNTGFMTEDEQLAQQLFEAAKEINDKVWRMPLDEEYQEALESPIADMINAHFDRHAGAITAACFLSRFTKKYPWAHLDIAGTAWVSGKKRHATGRPVPLLTQLLYDVASS